MNKKDIELLKLNGWIVECESPFEISKSETESFASNEAAEQILNSLKSEFDIEKTIIIETAIKFIENYNESNRDFKKIDSYIDVGVLGIKTSEELISYFYYFFKKEGLL